MTKSKWKITIIFAILLLGIYGCQSVETAVEENVHEEAETLETTQQPAEVFSENSDDTKKWKEGLNEDEEAETDDELKADNSAGQTYISTGKIEACTVSGTVLDALFQEEAIHVYEYTMPEIMVVNENAEQNVKKWAEREKLSFEQYSEAVYWLGDERYRDCLADVDAGNSMRWVPYGYTVTYEPERIDDAYISLRKYEDAYFGGPHGNMKLTGVVLDAKTGEKMELADFTGTKETILLAGYITEKLAAEENEYIADGYEGYLYEGYEETVQYIIANNPNFFIRDEAIVFIFNQYELADYSNGDIWVEVPFEVLSKLEDQVKDVEAAYKSADALCLPSQTNHYVVEIPAGKPWYVDLDGDGAKEEILYPEDGVNGIYVTLEISGEEFTFAIDEEIVEGYIGLTDIDVDDGQYELAVYAYGPSSDLTTTFFSYAGDELMEIGRIEGLANKANSSDGSYDLKEEYGIRFSDYDGDGDYNGDGEIGLYKEQPRTCITGHGRILSQKRMDMPDTTWVEGEWKLMSDTGLLEYQEKDYYELYNPWCNQREENPYELSGNVVMYETNSIDIEKSVVLDESDKIIRFLGTDGDEWIHVEVITVPGNRLGRGWIHESDAQSIENLWLVD